MTLLVGLVMGGVYFAVGYGAFNLLTHSRSISGGSMFWVLLWMSVSYGFTNFSWLWLWLSRDRHLAEWSMLILVWWFCCPLITRTFGGGLEPITIQRTTGSYHGYMALILLVGYLGLIVWNLWQMDGISGTIPFGKPKEEYHQFSLFDFVVADEPRKQDIEDPEEVYCRIYDWRSDKSLTYKSMKEGR